MLSKGIQNLQSTISDSSRIEKQSDEEDEL